MTTIVLVLRDPDSPTVNLRCEAFGSFLWRLRSVDTQDATGAVISAPAEPAAAVATVAGAAGLFSQGEDVYYVPSRSARSVVAGDKDGAWPQSVASRQRKLVRKSQGAIYRFPLEEDDGASIEAFVTDWTGMPSACGMAVHPAHPLSTGLDDGQRAAFTGRYCRHPLTGDLLPIWVADWVKPEFGTGAVLLNPGHNKPDLDFSRQVGLPVRFSLAPEGYDGSPEAWVNPPYIKSGRAIRGGFADGQPYDQAGNTYVQTVTGRGLAELHTDAGFGAFLVARVEPDGVAEVPWDSRRGTIAPSSGPATPPARLTPSPVLSAVDERVRGADLTVIAPSTQVETDVLALRLLLAESGIEPQVTRPPEVVVVGNATVKEKADDEVLRLALLVGGGALDTVGLKPQQIEPCERFLKVHETLVDGDTGAGGGDTVSPEVGKAATQVKGLLLRRDLKQAFTQLYRLQKSLAKSDGPVTEADRRRYAALAHVMAEVDGPYTAEVLSATWHDI